ncbi:hypothetical protein LB507_004778, partial [Fusarium sp. FIESC RH6]
MAGGLRSATQQHEMAERGANSSSRRIPEENDTVRSKLTDTHISILNYPDPLAPRPQLKTYPQGVTSDMEERWHQMLEESKSQT